MSARTPPASALGHDAERTEAGDQRLPLYFVDGELIRDGKVLHRFFYRHHGSFE